MGHAGDELTDGAQLFAVNQGLLRLLKLGGSQSHATLEIRALNPGTEFVVTIPR